MSKASSVSSIPNIITAPSSNDSSQTAELSINERRSRELIIGLCETVGSGVKQLSQTLYEVLKETEYFVYHIKLSDLIINSQPKADHDRLRALKGHERFIQLQDLGDKLRKDKSESILAKLAIKAIKTIRETDFSDNEASGNSKTNKKVAYIIDQLKNPSEVELFRQVYRNNFYLVGIISTTEQRVNNLISRGVEKIDVHNLMEKDRRGEKNFNQQVEDTLQRSDFFIKYTNKKNLTEAIERLNNLIHGVGNITPKSDEIGMYHAYSASLRSACLSRQVGASIMNVSGEVISTGCNDVPESGGGLYTYDSIDDRRCFNQSGECHNDKHKNILKEQIIKVLEAKGVSAPDVIASEIVKETKIKYLIEYSRAVHAEMDAITTLSRSPNVGSVGTTLYCTTYPCHNCTKHIIAAGIRRVVFIEPYEKSLASDLHEDAIEAFYGATNSSSDTKTKVQYVVFEGVSPNRYVQFFRLNRPRKNKGGIAIKTSIKDAYHVDVQQLDSYVDYEGRIVQDVDRIVIPTTDPESLV